MGHSVFILVQEKEEGIYLAAVLEFQHRIPDIPEFKFKPTNISSTFRQQTILSLFCKPMFPCIELSFVFHRKHNTVAIGNASCDWNSFFHLLIGPSIHHCVCVCVRFSLVLFVVSNQGTQKSSLITWNLFVVFTCRKSLQSNPYGGCNGIIPTGATRWIS